MRSFLLVTLALTMALPASAASPELAQPVTGLDIQHCIENLAPRARPDVARCPAYLIDAVKAAAATCTAVCPVDGSCRSTLLELKPGT